MLYKWVVFLVLLLLQVLILAFYHRCNWALSWEPPLWASQYFVTYLSVGFLRSYECQSFSAEIIFDQVIVYIEIILLVFSHLSVLLQSLLIHVQLLGWWQRFVNLLPHLLFFSQNIVQQGQFDLHFVFLASFVWRGPFAFFWLWWWVDFGFLKFNCQWWGVTRFGASSYLEWFFHVGMIWSLSLSGSELW